MITTVCKISGCSGRPVSKGLCDKHRKRLERHGHVEQTRPDDWGGRSDHPLYGTWSWHRRKAAAPLPKEWRDDFLAFARDVGERPSPRHVLRRIEQSRPYSKSNVAWVESNLGENPDDVKEYRREYQRQYRQQNPEKTRHAALKKQYGISLDDYNGLLELQGGKCAICRIDAAETKGRWPGRLHVDHCHESGVVRALLCHNCNTALGLLKHDKQIIYSAYLYL